MDNSNYEVDRIFLNKVLGHKVVIPILDVDFVKDFWKGVRLIKKESIKTLNDDEREIMSFVFDLHDDFTIEPLYEINENIINSIERKSFIKLKKLNIIILLTNIVLGSDKIISDNDILLMNKYFSDYFVKYYISCIKENKYLSIIKLLKGIELKDNIVLSNRQKRLLNFYGIKDTQEILDYIKK